MNLRCGCESRGDARIVSSWEKRGAGREVRLLIRWLWSWVFVGWDCSGLLVGSVIL